MMHFLAFPIRLLYLCKVTGGSLTEYIKLGHGSRHAESHNIAR